MPEIVETQLRQLCARADAIPWAREVHRQVASLRREYPVRSALEAGQHLERRRADGNRLRAGLRIGKPKARVRQVYVLPAELKNLTAPRAC